MVGEIICTASFELGEGNYVCNWHIIIPIPVCHHPPHQPTPLLSLGYCSLALASSSGPVQSTPYTARMKRGTELVTHLAPIQPPTSAFSSIPHPWPSTSATARITTYRHQHKPPLHPHPAHLWHPTCPSTDRAWASSGLLVDPWCSG